MAPASRPPGDAAPQVSGAFGADLAKELLSSFAWVPDFPRHGFLFPDITPLFEELVALRERVLDAITAEVARSHVDRVVLIDSFGYLLGTSAAQRLRLGMVLARRAGKLPRATRSATYAMCYDEGRRIEIHANLIQPGERCLIIDDIIGSGGTILAVARLLGEAGAVVQGACVVAHIPSLGGLTRLIESGVPVRWICDLKP